MSFARRTHRIQVLGISAWEVGARRANVRLWNTVKREEQQMGCAGLR